MTFFGIIVVEDRRIEAKHNNRRLGQFQPPDEQILQQLPEQVDPPVRKRPNEPFHGMRESQLFGTKNSRITLISLELIEPDQMTTRPIHEKAQHLQEQLSDKQSLAVLAQLAKQTLDKRKKLNAAKVHGKQTQTSPAGQLVIGWKNALNMLFLILQNPLIFAHVAL